VPGREKGVEATSERAIHHTPLFRYTATLQMVPRIKSRFTTGGGGGGVVAVVSTPSRQESNWAPVAGVQRYIYIQFCKTPNHT
jgi:hypothetical protein